MGVKFAAALGAEVTVLSHSLSKRDDALAMGASDFCLIKEIADLKPLRRRFDLVLNTVSASLDINSYLDILRINGSMAIIGLPDAPYSVRAGALLNGGKSMIGSMVGGIPETQEMLNFAGSHNITSDVEVITADYVNQAYLRTIASDVKYRFVIDANSF